MIYKYIYTDIAIRNTALNFILVIIVITMIYSMAFKKRTKSWFTYIIYV